MTERWALIDQTGKVVNTILWDGVDQDAIPAGFTAVLSDAAGIGDDYAKGAFTPTDVAVDVVQPALPINPADPLTKQIVSILVAAGVLTSDRAAQILAS